MLPGRSPARVEGGLLDEEHKGMCGMLAAPGSAFGGSDFLQAAAQVDGSGPAAGGVFPGDRRGEGIIDLKHPRTVAVASQPAPVPGRKAIPGNLHQLARGDIE